MNHIVIVGGGTSGWMAAIAISSHFPDKKITVIDPTAISPIGVGESVTGVVQSFVGYPPHGLSITDFYRETDATLKLGIWYKNWRGQNDEYLTPIDSPNRFFDHHYSADVEDFFAMITAQGHSICELQTHGRLMRKNKTDYCRNPDGTINNRFSMASCQFDALKFAAWLKADCKKRETITHVDDIVERFEQDAETGMITKVVTEKGEEIAGDFYLDCTGFRRRIYAQAYSPEWVDLSQYLKVDSAIPSPVEYAEGEEIPVYTSATALKNGWMWQVPTQARMGKGYVYSSKHTSDEDAIAELRQNGVDPGDDPRIIRFKVGKYSKQWQKNVCAIGLAGGFLEPLEATTIHIIHVQIRMLTELFLPYFSRESAEPLSAKFNSMMETMYSDYVDFVSLHYHSGRDDTEFWRDYQKPESVTPANQERLARWAHSFPTREDFEGIQTSRVLLTSSIMVWMPMLEGLGLLNPEMARIMIERSKFGQQTQANASKYFSVGNTIVDNAVSQQEAIAFLTGQK
jgi:hypothetical protein